MASTIERLPSRAGQTGMDVAVVGKAQNQNKEGISITVAIFFDGTLNNRINSNTRIAAGAGGQLKQWAGTSYANWHSNVSLLEHFNRKREPSRREVSIYVEGIGTTDGAGDTLWGYALGMGETGIIGKVNRGVNLIREWVNWLVAAEEEVFVEEIKLDVFGFSRGAAAARNFISLFTYAPRSLATRINAPQARIVLKFVGLFDTVASHGPKHTDDVDELNLRLGNHAKKVVQLQAGDEYRENFSLTDVRSTLGSGGYQLTLPGAHSDIGGGYVDGEGEERELFSWEVGRLKQEGWYRDGEIHETQVPVYSTSYGSEFAPPTMITKYRGQRAHVGNTYQYIPLAIMLSCATQHEMRMHSVSEELYSHYRPTAALLPLQARIDQAVNGHGRAGNHALTLAGLGLPPPQIALVRNLHLHRSANESKFGMGGNFEGHVPTRRIFPG